jgi:hypothetical protein
MSSASKPRARLTKDQAVQIFKSKLDSPQLSSSALATYYYVSEKTVRDIWTGRTWSKETWHLDTSRALQLKQPGRPKGRKDKQPRKKRIRGMHDDVLQSSLSRGSDELSGPVSVRIGLTEDAIDQREFAVYIDRWLKTRCCQRTMQGFKTFCDGEYDETCSEDSSSWHHSGPKRSYNTAERQPPSIPLHHASVDEQLHDWRAFWSSYPSADPFRCDWTPQPFEYA